MKHPGTTVETTNCANHSYIHTYITQFLKYLDDEIKSLVSEVRLNGHSNIWKQLVKACLAYLIVFNRRREGEVSQLALETYTKRPNYKIKESDVLRKTMSTTETILSETYSYMTTCGKHNRMVALVFASEIKKAFDTLVKVPRIGVSYLEKECLILICP